MFSLKKFGKANHFPIRKQSINREKIVFACLFVIKGLLIRKLSEGLFKYIYKFHVPCIKKLVLGKYNRKIYRFEGIRLSDSVLE
jgi:hypothetical protein